MQHAEMTFRILIVTSDDFPIGAGFHTRAELLKSAFSERGIVVEVLSYHPSRSLPSFFSRLRFIGHIYRAARRNNITYVLDPLTIGFPVMVASFFAFRPYALSVRTDHAWEQSARYGMTETLDEFVNTPLRRKPFSIWVRGVIERNVAVRARRVLVTSQYMKRIVTLWGVNPSSIIVVYDSFHASDLPLEKQGELRRRHGLYGTILFSSGKLVPKKGFRTLINLMPEIVAVIPEAILHIAGDGPDKEELQRIITSRGLEAHVRLLGVIPHKELMERIASADMYILNTGHEGFSQDILEVMACGTPIITTDVGGNTELIEDGKTGFLVTYNDTQALRSAILALFESPDRAWALSAQAQAFGGRFTEKRMIDETVEVLKTASGMILPLKKNDIVQDKES